MMYRHYRVASVLILCVGFITVAVVLASAFLVAVTGKLNAGREGSFSALAYYGVRSAENHAFEAILRSYQEARPYTNEDEVWRTEFLALDQDGRPVPTLAKAIGDVEQDPMVNAEDRMMYLELIEGGFGYNMNRSRWINLSYYDGGLDPLPVDNVDDAQYVVRYSVFVTSLDGAINVNQDYDRVAFDPSRGIEDQSQAYRNYRQYVDHYSRMLLSIAGSRLVQGARGNLLGNNVAQDIYGTHPIDPVPPLHHWGETVDFEVGNTNSADNLRLQVAAAFHGSGMHWGGNDDLWSDHYYRSERWNYVRQADKDWRWGNARLNLLMPGPLYSPGQIRSLKHDLYDDHQWGEWQFNRTTQEYWTTHNKGIRPDDPVPHGNGQTYGFHCPWRLNLLTAYDEALRSLIYGLSSHIRFKQSGKDRIRSAPLDVFGAYYPDPFPLGLDDGRDVDVVRTAFGSDYATVDGSAFHQRHHRKRQGKTIEPAYANSYWWDIAFALHASTTAAQNAWGFKNGDDGTNYIHKDPRSGNPDCRIDISETNPAAMMRSVEEEFLRILGESLVNPGNGLLAGNTVRTGYFFQRSDMYESHLRPYANHRGMEYALNDVRMSVFGSEALDFNGDGHPESTINGWVEDINGSSSRIMYSWEGPYGERFRFIDPANATPALAGYRWNDHQWQPMSLTERAEVFERYQLWLDATWENNSPIRPFSKTGRLTIGKSRYYKALTDCQVYDRLLDRRLASVTSESIIVIDPDENGEVGDSHVQYRRTHLNLREREE